MTCYHVTTGWRFKQIAAEGLRPDAPPEHWADSQSCIWLALKPPPYYADRPGAVTLAVQDPAITEADFDAAGECAWPKPITPGCLRAVRIVDSAVGRPLL